MKRIALSVVTALLGFLLVTAPADASIGWCKTDPLIVVENHLADILVSAPLEALVRVTGPTDIVITVPEGVDAAVILSGIGFGRGETVSIVESKAMRVRNGRIPIRVSVYVPANDSSLPVQVEFAPDVIGLLNPVVAQGTANSWIRLTTYL